MRTSLWHHDIQSRLFALAAFVALIFAGATALADAFDGEWEGRLGPARWPCSSLPLDALEVSAAVTGGYVALDIIEPGGRAPALEGQRLFAQVQRRVVVNSDQTPEYSDIRRAGHDGGDFIFVRGR